MGLRHWEEDWNSSIDSWQRSFEPRRIELESRRNAMIKSGFLPEEWREISRQLKEHTQKVEAKMEFLSQFYAEQKKQWEDQLSFYVNVWHGSGVQHGNGRKLR
jgi:hypothetical protein